jgi:osmotically-inducible protein OsmY
MRDRDRDDFDRWYGNGSGPEGYGGRERADFRPRKREDFDDGPESFGMNLQGNFGFDRGGEGSAGYFGGSDRGRPTTSSYASGHGRTGGDLDRGFAGNSAAGGTDRGYSGGFNYGFGGNAYRSGMAHDRFADVRPELRSQEQTVRGYRGVGPKSYRRGDDQLRELVCERLSDDDHVDASEIEVTVENGVVRLAGTVPDRRMKRLAEDVADSVRGVVDIENQLRIG